MIENFAIFFNNAPMRKRRPNDRARYRNPTNPDGWENSDALLFSPEFTAYIERHNH